MDPAPARDFRLRSFSKLQLDDDSKKVLPGTSDTSLPRTPRTESVTKLLDPGRAEKGSSEDFFNGKHTTPYEKDRSLGHIGDRYTPAEIARFEKQRAQQHQTEIKSFVEDVRREKSERAALEEAQKRKDYDDLIKYDPWSKPGTARPTNALVSKEKLDEKYAASSAGETYNEIHFGKSGAGAPVRSGSGKVRAHVPQDTELHLTNAFRGQTTLAASARYARPDESDMALYKASLDAQSAERARIIAEEKQIDAQIARELAVAEPFLRPSQVTTPRTTPRRDPRDSAERERQTQYKEALEVQAQEQRQRRQAERAERAGEAPDYEPWGRGVGVVERDINGKLLKKSPVSPANLEPSYIDLMEQHNRGGGAPVEIGSGRMISPRPADADDLYDPYGKPGGGAPTQDPRRLRATTEMYTGSGVSSAASSYRGDFLKEQQRLLVEHQQMVASRREADRLSPHNPDAFFKFGQGAANPKRDEFGNISKQAMLRTDVTDTSAESTGGLGRKPRGEATTALATQLDRQEQERRQIAAEQRLQEMLRDDMHVKMATSWHGKQGAGAPRYGADGLVTGRYAVDQEVHYEDLADTPKNVPVKDRVQYGRDLDRLVQERQRLTKETKTQGRKKSISHTETASRSYGRPGGGAPVRSSSGKVVAARGANARSSADAEWRLNAKPGHRID